MPRSKGARDADYDAKRAVLLRRMTVRLMRREVARPSLRQLAEAAGVSVATLRHYFGGRTQVMDAILEALLLGATARLAEVAEAPLPFPASMREYAEQLLRAFRAPREVGLGDIFAVSIAEGLLDPAIGPAALRFIVDPSVATLQHRLAQHQARGEMRAGDARAAALALLSPLLIALLHQDHMGGAECSPVDLDAVAAEIVDSFVRGWQASEPRAGAA